VAEPLTEDHMLDAQADMAAFVAAVARWDESALNSLLEWMNLPLVAGLLAQQVAMYASTAPRIYAHGVSDARNGAVDEEAMALGKDRELALADWHERWRQTSEVTAELFYRDSRRPRIRLDGTETGKNDALALTKDLKEVRGEKAGCGCPSGCLGARKFQRGLREEPGPLMPFRAVMRRLSATLGFHAALGTPGLDLRRRHLGSHRNERAGGNGQGTMVR
jgi:hypothetical protein